MLADRVLQERVYALGVALLNLVLPAAMGDTSYELQIVPHECKLFLTGRVLKSALWGPISADMLRYRKTKLLLHLHDMQY